MSKNNFDNFDNSDNGNYECKTALQILSKKTSLYCLGICSPTSKQITFLTTLY